MARHLLTLARLIAGAVPSSLAFSFLLAALLAILNPESRFGTSGILAAWAILLIPYGLPLVILFPLAVAAVRFFAARPLRLSWLHLKSIVWFLVAGVGLGAAVYATNLARGGDLLSGEASSGLGRALGALLALWGAGALAAAAAQVKGSREGRTMFRVALACLLAAPPAALVGLSSPRPAPPAAPAAAAGSTPRAGTLVILGLEGATFSELLPLVAEGRLPAFAELIRSGAYGPLATVTPCRSAAAWASLSTGRLPSGHGIRADGLYGIRGAARGIRTLPHGILFRSRLPSSWLLRRPAGPSDLLARPLWEILERSRLPGRFSGWPLAGGEGDPAGADPSAGIFQADRWLARIMDGVTRGASPAAEAELRRALPADASTAKWLLSAIEQRDRSRPAVLAARMSGPAAASGIFAEAGRASGEVEDGEGAARAAVGRYYEVLDGVVGRVRGALDPDDYLIVVSAYGEEPLSTLQRAGRRLLGLPAPRSSHTGGPAGVLLLQGPGVNGGRQVDDMRVTDVVPLALYILGLPVGRDMDGRLPRRLFARPFLEAHPISFLSTYG